MRRYVILLTITYMLLELVLGVIYVFGKVSWWDTWLILSPVFFLVFGLYYCSLIRRHLDEKVSTLKWLVSYKLGKLLAVVVVLLCYALVVKSQIVAMMVSFSLTYLVSLVIETWIFSNYRTALKN